MPELYPQVTDGGDGGGGGGLNANTSLYNSYVPATKTALFTATQKTQLNLLALSNTNTTPETVVLYVSDGVTEVQVYKLQLVADDTAYIVDFIKGIVLETGGSISAETTTADKVTVSLSGVEGVLDSGVSGYIPDAKASIATFSDSNAISTFLIHNTNTTTENVIVYLYDGTTERVLLNVQLKADDTAYVVDSTTGLGVDSGYEIRAVTNTASKVSFSLAYGTGATGDTTPATSFDALSDTPASKVEQAGKITKVNDTETALEYVDTGGIDEDAIHVNVAGEIAAITEKATPVSADLLVIEDSADSNNKKRVQIGNLPSSGAGSGVRAVMGFESQVNVTQPSGEPIAICELAKGDYFEPNLHFTDCSAYTIRVRNSDTGSGDGKFALYNGVTLIDTQTQAFTSESEHTVTFTVSAAFSGIPKVLRVDDAGDTLVANVYIEYAEVTA